MKVRHDASLGNGRFANKPIDFLVVADGEEKESRGDSGLFVRKSAYEYNEQRDARQRGEWSAIGRETGRHSRGLGD